jgi:NADPH-dependent curcumin reductase CurA
MNHMRQSVVLQRRPVGELSADDFAFNEEPIPTPGAGEVLTKTLWLSVDPGMRVRMNEAKTYAPRFELGSALMGETVGQVLVSNDPRFVSGQIVVGARGWQSHVVSAASALMPLPRNAPHSAYLGVLGMPGTTAYTGMKDIGQPKRGETVVVSAASGAVGSVAGQIAKRNGARVVGIAGGADKVAFVRDVLKFDDCIDHRRTPDLAASLRQLCPDGIDVYFENVGGAVQRAVFPLMNAFGRMVMSGMASEYNDAVPQPGPNLAATFLKRLRIQGFICGDQPENFAEWRALAAPWIEDGSLRYREHVVHGLDQAPMAMIDLARGENFGKVVVQVSSPA